MATVLTYESDTGIEQLMPDGEDVNTFYINTCRGAHMDYDTFNEAVSWLLESDFDGPQQARMIAEVTQRFLEDNG
jgi:hypothetical protein